MRLVILGLSLSSSWGNGHATTYRALARALARAGVEVLFLERDKPWYAEHRDLRDPDYCTLALYRELADLERFRDAVRDADAVIVGSYVPDGARCVDWALKVARGPVAFYDIDTPVTLAALSRDACDYLAREQIPRLALTLSFSAGPALARYEREFGARRAIALPCGVDPDRHRPISAGKRWDCAYLGAYAPDRQRALEAILLDAALAAPALRFCVAGALYPDHIRWPANVERIEHVPPDLHADFYAAARLSLNLTRADMRALGYSPSVRLFEAAACAAPIASDRWPGIETFFTPKRELALVERADDLLALLDRPDALAALGAAARARVLAEHTGDHRAQTLLSALAEA